MLQEAETARVAILRAQTGLQMWNLQFSQLVLVSIAEANNEAIPTFATSSLQSSSRPCSTASNSDGRSSTICNEPAGSEAQDSQAEDGHCYAPGAA